MKTFLRSAGFNAMGLVFVTALTVSAAEKVLMVVPQVDFYYQEYNDPRQVLEKAGFQVVVAAPTLRDCVPHPESGQGGGSGTIKPDLTLQQAKGADYRALIFVGGWGASMYQYAFPGKYQNPEYNLSKEDREAVNRLVNEFYSTDKILAGICHGVTDLAWARVAVDGKSKSPISGKTVVGYEGGGPACEINSKMFDDGAPPTRWHIEKNGGKMLTAKSDGNPANDPDAVKVDGNVITAQNYNSAQKFGEVLVAQLQKKKS